jgi:hypothetical protein
MADYTQAVRFNQNQLMHPVVHNSDSPPSVQSERNGQIYYNTSTHLLYYWSINQWISATGAPGEGAYQQTIGNSQDTQITVTHNLGTTAVSVQLYSLSPLNLVEADVTVVDANSVRLSFGYAPDTASLHVLVFARASTIIGGTTGGGFTAVIIDSDYAASPGDCVLADATNGDITVTMPTSPSNGDTMIIKKLDASEFIVYLLNTVGTVDGDNAPTIETQGVSATLLFDGYDWHVIALVG